MAGTQKRGERRKGPLFPCFPEYQTLGIGALPPFLRVSDIRYREGCCHLWTLDTPLGWRGCRREERPGAGGCRHRGSSQRSSLTVLSSSAAAGAALPKLLSGRVPSS